MGWTADPQRTTYLLDVRTAEEVVAQPAPGFRHAPGGQLIQATDMWVGVRGARIVLADAEEVRAPVVAGWRPGAGARGVCAVGRRRSGGFADAAGGRAAAEARGGAGDDGHGGA